MVSYLEMMGLVFANESFFVFISLGEQNRGVL